MGDAASLAGETEFDVIVIGAGMAGLTAARALAERGFSVCVLEAQDRVGGRIMTLTVDGEVIELGAEFVHGRPPELWALIEEAGLSTYELDGSQVRSEGAGRLTKVAEAGDFSVLEGLEEFTGEDCGFLTYLDRRQIEGEERDRIVGFVEGFNAADARIVSVKSLGVQQKAEDAIEGDRLWRVREGYSRVPEYLAARLKELGGELRLASAAAEVRWTPGAVQVIEAEGRVTLGKRVVIAVPLGVLQSNGVRFTPAPADRLELAGLMKMGQVCRFTLQFRRRFWTELPETNTLSFLYAFGEAPAVWWTTEPEHTRCLTGWIGGPRSDALAGKSDNELGSEACETLARVLGLDAVKVRELLLRCEVHGWREDEWTRGAYSYVPAGGLDLPRRLGQPVEQTVYFAGEHTDITGHWGTVHAAMRSGLRVAEQIDAHRDGRETRPSSPEGSIPARAVSESSVKEVTKQGSGGIKSCL